MNSEGAIWLLPRWATTFMSAITAFPLLHENLPSTRNRGAPARYFSGGFVGEKL
jgi:hypothetical protein